MSYLSTELASILARRKLKGVDLARRSGLSQSMVSRYLNGEQVYISDDDLEKLLIALTDDGNDRARIIAARMRDVCVGPGSEQIKIQIGSGPLIQKNAPLHYETNLPPKVEDALRAIREAIPRDPDLRDIIISLARRLPAPKPKPISDNPVLDPNAPIPAADAVKPKRRRLWKGERGVEPIEEN